MIFEEYVGGKLIITESRAEEELLIKFSKAVSTYDINKTPTVERTKLKALWLKLEFSAKQTLHSSMGVKRTDVFECTDEDE